MLMRILILSLTVLCCLAAEEAKLPPDAQAAIDKAEKSISAAQSKADAEILKVRQDLVKALTKAQESATKKGDLNSALAIKAQIDELSKLTQAALLEPKVYIDSKKLKSYSAKVWDSMPGTLVTISTAEVGSIAIAEDEEVVIVPHPSDTWAASSSYPMVPYTGSGQPYSNMSYMCLVWVLRGDKNSTGAVDPTIPLRGPGTLSLRPNDGRLDDNLGTMRVKVIVQKSK